MFFNYNTYNIFNTEVHTIGCELNMSDALKFALTLDNNKPSIVFNTCTLLKEREIESQYILNILSKAYPEKEIYVLGCDLVNNPDKYNQYKNLYPSNNLIEYLKNNKINNQQNIVYKLEKNKIYNGNYFCFKVQNGCHMNCSFCLINRTRRPIYSLPYKDIKEQLGVLLYNKTNVLLELCGTELSEYYDREFNIRFPDLIIKILEDFPQIEKLHIGALDPASKDVEKVIDIMSESSRFVKLLNISAQSGSDTILKLMRRRHNTQRLRDIHNYASEKGVKIGWDIIVGFPNETEKLFNETVDLVKELQPMCENIFKYSKRNGTDASLMDNQVSEEIKLYRINYLKSIIKEYIKNDDDYNTYFRIFDKENNNTVYSEIIKDNNNIFLNVLNESEMINFIKQYNGFDIVHIKYNLKEHYLMDMYINFIKQYKKAKIMLHCDDQTIIKYYQNKFSTIYYDKQNILYMF